MSDPSVYFTTRPCSCVDPRIGRKLHRVDCPERCPVVRYEDAGPKMLGAGRGRAQFAIRCNYTAGHIHEHVGQGMDWHPVVWR